jgi:hypothetical protein
MVMELARTCSFIDDVKYAIKSLEVWSSLDPAKAEANRNAALALRSEFGLQTYDPTDRYVTKCH